MNERRLQVLDIGLVLKACPLPLLVDIYSGQQGSCYSRGCSGMELRTCWQALGLPAVAAGWNSKDMLHHDEMLPDLAWGWDNKTILLYFRQQAKLVAFASGQHLRLGAESFVFSLDQHILVKTVDQVLIRIKEQSRHPY